MRMNSNIQTGKRKNAYMGLGIALGAGIGILIGLLFLDGNIAFGMGIGVAVGMVLGMITDELGRPPLQAFAGIMIGATVGTMLGTVIGLANGWYNVSQQQAVISTLFGLPFEPGYAGPAALIIASAGMVAGTRAEVVQDHRA